MIKVLRWLSDITVAALAGILVIPLAAGAFGIRTYCVQSGSMEPVLKTGSLIFTGQSKDVKAGDIITFQKWDMPVTHRVVSVQNGMYVTKGDANIKADQGGVLEKEMIGKVMLLPGERYCIPHMGYVHMWIARWRIGITGLLISYVVLRKSDRKKEKIC